MSKSATPMPGSVPSGPDISPVSLREAVLAGPGVQGQSSGVGSPLAMVATPEAVAAAMRAAGYTEKRRGTLTGAVTTVLVLGLCLYYGQGYAGVIARLWPLLASFNPAVVMCAPVCAVALSQAGPGYRSRCCARCSKRLRLLANR